MKCPNCGKHVKANAKFCLHCGYPLQHNVSKSSPTMHKQRHLHKKAWCLISVLIIIILIGGGIWCKRYFTPAHTFSRQLPKSVWIETHKSASHKRTKKAKRNKKNKKSRNNKSRIKTHHSYIVSNGKQLLSFGKSKKSTKIFNVLSSNSHNGKQLRNNLSKNMRNSIIQGHYSYHIKGDNLYFNDGTSYRNIKKSKGGFSFKRYKNKKFLHKEHVKTYKSLNEPIK